VLNPDIEVFQVVAMKAMISTLLLLLVLNVKIKHVMYDCIDPESIGALAFKTV